MKVRGELVEALFLKRLNRFAALVNLEGREALAHVPNSGRMRELLRPGARVYLAPRSGPRKTPFDLLMAAEGDRLVSVDSRLPPALLAEALAQGRLPELGPFRRVRREVDVGESRLDLLGEGAGGLCFIETKSVTLVRDGVALFPDAPTSRGVRHLEELRRIAEGGQQGVAVFVIQRDDAERFSPFEEADPSFAATLRAVAPAVRVLAYGCRVTRDEIQIDRPVAVVL